MKNKFLKVFVSAVFICYTLCPVFYMWAEAQEEAKGERLSGSITFDFKDAEINSVLKIISMRSGVNIVAGPEVQGTVTMRLVDVPWEKALDVILKTYGFAYERQGNVIRVTTSEHLSKEGLQTEVYTLNYARSKEIVEGVRDMLSERGKMRYDERANVLIVTDIASNLYKISRVVAELDKRTTQVLIEAKVIETVLSPTESLGINWNVEVTASGAKRPSTFPFRSEGLKPISSNVAEFFPKGDDAADFPTLAIPAFPLTPGSLSLGTTVGQFTFGTLDFSNFSAILRMISSRTDTKLIANPRIATLNHKPAIIQVGDTYKLPKFELNESTGRYEIVGFGDEIKVGVILSVTPHINDKKEIVVELHPEVSSYEGTVVIAQTATTQTTALRFNKREATTQVMVRDGETIAIGGLVREDVSETRTKVPILGDIPILGLPFTYKSKTVTKKDLLIFVTIRLLDGGQPLPADTTAELISQPLQTTAATTAKEVPAAAAKTTREKNSGNKGYLLKKD
ncbi:MAG: secretin N-terminal domain-containing protein [Candidatus Omnitrophota bacterium]